MTSFLPSGTLRRQGIAVLMWANCEGPRIIQNGCPVIQVNVAYGLEARPHHATS